MMNAYLRVAKSIQDISGAGWVKIDPLDHSKSFVGPKTIYCPMVTNELELYVMAHECGHIFLRHSETPYICRQVVDQEVEATRWAFCMMRQCGVNAGTATRRWAKASIAGYADVLHKCGWETASSSTARYVRGIEPAFKSPK